MAKSTVAKTHSEWSASGSSIWMNCAGQPNAAREIPEDLKDKGNVFADQGTAAHGLLEQCLSDGEDAADYMDRCITVDADGHAEIQPRKYQSKGRKNEFIVDAEMAESVQVGIDFVHKEVARLVKEYKLKKSQVVVSLEVRCYPLEGYKDMYGTSDIIISCPYELVVADYKHGRVAVEVKENTQLRYYGLGSARREKFKQRIVKLTIIQPRGQGADEPVRSEVLTMKQLIKWGDVLEAALKASMRKDAELTPGPHCKWCEVAAAKMCKALTKKTQEIARMDFDVPVKKAKLRIPETADEMAKIIPYLPMIRAWLRSTEKAIVISMMNGTKVASQKLVAKKSNRKLRDDLSEKALMKKLMKFIEDDDEMFDVKLKGVAQLEKLVPKERRKKFHEELVVKPQGAPTFAHEDDPRPTLPKNAKFDFQDEEFDE